MSRGEREGETRSPEFRTGNVPGICTVGMFGSHRGGQYCSDFKNDETSSKKLGSLPKVPVYEAMIPTFESGSGSNTHDFSTIV